MPFAPHALAEYARALALPGTAHGICEDYRAAAGIDLEHDRADRAAGRRLEPLACGHYIAEEAPDALLTRALPFLAQAREPV